eukprot:TRINITY_DN21639_c0_g1_i2.p1 TRINITY_DN21639_c0_g1~~TRINITY_DN21639_c0_g1_i2.p1  ORF type:complete len:522 (-),score=49.11 TRINITY_DN21639_c0_g1_i2:442-2007(-)
MSFSENYRLKRHMATHLEDKPFKCKICSRGFNRADCLKDHMEVHTVEKRHKCAVCLRSFSRRDTLSSHMRTHNKNSGTHCEYCNKYFVREDRLRFHVRTYHTDKSEWLPCDVCSKVFPNQRILRRHRKRHDGNTKVVNKTDEVDNTEVVFMQCFRCQKLFKNIKPLMKHLHSHKEQGHMQNEVTEDLVVYVTQQELIEIARSKNAPQPFYSNFIDVNKSASTQQDTKVDPQFIQAFKDGQDGNEMMHVDVKEEAIEIAGVDPLLDMPEVDSPLEMSKTGRPETPKVNTSAVDFDMPDVDVLLGEPTESTMPETPQISAAFSIPTERPTFVQKPDPSLAVGMPETDIALQGPEINAVLGVSEANELDSLQVNSIVEESVVVEVTPILNSPNVNKVPAIPVTHQRFQKPEKATASEAEQIKNGPHACFLCSKSFGSQGDLQKHMRLHFGSNNKADKKTNVNRNHQQRESIATMLPMTDNGGVSRTDQFVHQQQRFVSKNVDDVTDNIDDFIASDGEVDPLMIN